MNKISTTLRCRENFHIPNADKCFFVTGKQNPDPISSKTPVVEVLNMK